MPDRPAAERKTILCVDNDPDTLLALRRILRRKGYRAVTATTGWDAVRLALQAPPDLILLGALPDIDAYTTMRTISRLCAGASPPFAVLTEDPAKDGVAP